MAEPEEEELGQGVHGAVCTSALLVRDCKGRALAATRQGSLTFVGVQQAGAPAGGGAGGGGSGGATATLWLLAAAGPGCYTLQSADSGHFLAAADGQIVLSAESQAKMQLFMDLDRRVLVRLPGKACLQSGPGGAAALGRLPLGRDRGTKLFTLEEAALPRHSLAAWPLRAALRCERGGGGYLSASGLALSASAPVACCSEEFVLALCNARPLPGPGCDAGLTASTSVWAGDGRRLLSHDAATGQVLLAPQHGCAGGERFRLQLYGSGELELLAEPAQEAGAAQQQQQQQQQQEQEVEAGSADGGGSKGGAAPAEPAAVAVQQHGLLSSRGASKPTRFALELASCKPTLLLTAHGQLLGCPGHAASRPAGVLLPGPAAAGGGGGGGGADCDALAAAAQGCAWLLHHHGEAVYSLRHAASGRSLYVDELGAPCLDTAAGGGRVVYPDERLLFFVEPAWAALHGGKEQAATPGSGGSRDGSGGGSDGEDGGGSGGEEGAEGAAPAGTPLLAAAGFACPAPSGPALVSAGFSIRSLLLVGGRHVYLSVLPDGLVTTVYATDRPSRWETFAPVDCQTLVQSLLRLLEQLPRGPASAQQAQQAQLQPLRRTASMQALSVCDPGSPLGSAAGVRRQGSHASLPRPPSLPAVSEHQPQHSGLAHAESAPVLPAVQEQGEQRAAGRRPPRRSQSETALAQLAQQQRLGRLSRPLWLAELLRPQRPPEGWGLCSAASLQELACRQLCASLVQRYCQQQGGGRRLPPGLVAAVEAELSAHLPEEVAACIARELRLLAEPPAPTKLSLHQLAVAAEAATASKATGAPPAEGLPPSWAYPFLQGGGHGGAAALQWQATEAHLCCACRGASGPLLPLDPWVNPSHYLFLSAMERRARGGGRVRMRGRRRLDREDPLVAVLKTGKILLLAWAGLRTVGALLA